MKKNMTMRFASLLLVATLLTTCAISGTFAKYTSEKSASDSARVAKWSFMVNNNDIASNSFTFNLFDHNDANVATVEGKKIIAPGTSGSFALTLENKSEVPAEYTIDYTVANNGVPIQYKVGEGNWENDITDVTTAVKLAPNATDTINIQWQWVFNGNDATDTGLGKATSLAQPTVTAAITATQVD